MTPAQIAALGAVPSDSELITLYRYALANGWAGTTRQVGGGGSTRSVTFASPKELLDMIERLEARVTAAAQTTCEARYGLVVFGKAR